MVSEADASGGGFKEAAGEIFEDRYESHEVTVPFNFPREQVESRVVRGASCFWGKGQALRPFTSALPETRGNPEGEELAKVSSPLPFRPVDCMNTEWVSL